MGEMLVFSRGVYEHCLSAWVAFGYLNTILTAVTDLFIFTIAQ